MKNRLLALLFVVGMGMLSVAPTMCIYNETEFTVFKDTARRLDGHSQVSLISLLAKFLGNLKSSTIPNL